jgi:peptide/nickel transport system substrate-binding protein
VQVKVLAGQRAAHGLLRCSTAPNKLIERRTYKDKNPFNDIKVREALYRAIDIDVRCRRRSMRGLSRNTGALVAPAIPGYEPSQLDERQPYDPETAPRSSAGRCRLSQDGFSFTFVMNCQSDSSM